MAVRLARRRPAHADNLAAATPGCQSHWNSHGKESPKIGKHGAAKTPAGCEPRDFHDNEGMSAKPAEGPWPPISFAEAADGRDADAGASLARSVVVPAYNEGGRLGSTLPCLLRFLEDFRPDSEVIVVDDGSRAGTARVLIGRLLDRAVTRLLVPGIRDTRCRSKGFRREAAGLRVAAEVAKILAARAAGRYRP